MTSSSSKCTEYRTRIDKSALVCCVHLENEFLPISNTLDSKAEAKNQGSYYIAPQGGGRGRGGVDQQHRQHGDKHPHALHQPQDKKAAWNAVRCLKK